MWRRVCLGVLKVWEESPHHHHNLTYKRFSTMPEYCAV